MPLTLKAGAGGRYVYKHVSSLIFDVIVEQYDLGPPFYYLFFVCPHWVFCWVCFVLFCFLSCFYFPAFFLVICKKKKIFFRTLF